MKRLIVLLLISLMLSGCSGGEDTIEKNTPTIDLSIPQRDGTIGKSDKDYLELTESKAYNMNNDVTGNWKLSTFAKSVDLNEYLVSYNELYMSISEVHVIVNFNYNTTTIVNDFGDRLSVRVHEYVKKEEHDAKVVGGGLLLGEYEIYKDNGDIIRLD